jgi:catalase
VVVPTIGGVTTKKGEHLAADHALFAAPSIFFNAIALCPSADGASLLSKEAAAIDWLRDAFGHLRIVDYVEDARALFDAVGVDAGADEGVVALANSGSVATFISAAKRQRILAREPTLRSPADRLLPRQRCRPRVGA